MALIVEQFPKIQRSWSCGRWRWALVGESGSREAWSLGYILTLSLSVNCSILLSVFHGMSCATFSLPLLTEMSEMVSRIIFSLLWCFCRVFVSSDDKNDEYNCIVAVTSLQLISFSILEHSCDNILWLFMHLAWDCMISLSNELWAETKCVPSKLKYLKTVCSSPASSLCRGNSWSVVLG